MILTWMLLAFLLAVSYFTPFSLAWLVAGFMGAVWVRAKLDKGWLAEYVGYSKAAGAMALYKVETIGKDKASTSDDTQRPEVH